MILWPSVLPQYLLVSGYSEALGNQLLRTEMDAGPAKARRRFTAAPRPVTGEIIVTREQLMFFHLWFGDVLKGGSLRFGWVDPFSDTALTNLVTNGGFDSTITGWTAENGSISSVSGGIYGKCLQITSSEGDYQSAYFTLASPCSVGNIYNLSMYVKSGTSVDNAYLFGLVNPGTAWTENQAGNSSEDWVHDHMEITADANSLTVEVMKNTAHADSPGTMLFDEVMLVDITTGVVEMRFTAPPMITAIEPDIFSISMQLEILP